MKFSNATAALSYSSSSFSYSPAATTPYTRSSPRCTSPLLTSFPAVASPSLPTPPERGFNYARNSDQGLGLPAKSASLSSGYCQCYVPADVDADYFFRGSNKLRSPPRCSLNSFRPDHPCS